MSCLPSIRVYNGMANTAGVVFGEVDAGTAALYDFTNIVRMTMLFDVDGTETAIDSDDAPTAITWGTTSGEVTFALGDQAIPAGTYSVKLVIHGATGSGLLLDVNESGYSLEMQVV